jgi:outer membrane lipoprotein-sorting protein
MKKVLFLTAALAAGLSFTAAAQSPDAAAIVRESRNLINAGTVSTRSRIVTTARNGRTSEQVIDQYSKKDAEGRARTLVVFQQPENVRNTRFLTLENTRGSDEQWIFMPSLKKDSQTQNRARRIEGSEGGGSFMGTDFSYDDMSLQTRNSDSDTHRLLREEALNGAPCYVIESTPGDSGFLYSKYVQWIEGETKIPRKIELYDKRGTAVKVLEILEAREVQGRLTPNITKITTLAAGTSTTIYMDIIKYDDPIPEGVFTRQYLETGRGR